MEKPKEVEMRSPAESDDDNMSVQDSDDDDNDYQVGGTDMGHLLHFVNFEVLTMLNCTVCTPYLIADWLREERQRRKVPPKTDPANVVVMTRLHYFVVVTIGYVILLWSFRITTTKPMTLAMITSSIKTRNISNIK